MEKNGGAVKIQRKNLGLNIQVVQPQSAGKSSLGPRSLILNKKMGCDVIDEVRSFVCNLP